ncbi:hypothetical protein [Aquincola tertiaricarbonis]|uniref:hypothetical protein n=1 Tax=Aquincola tertiaricarbonis TaxID=391953 RepID=UPI0018DD7F95|nr:hypothetical protein [Aquincola tertiaricarbonis]
MDAFFRQLEEQKRQLEDLAQPPAPPAPPVAPPDGGGGSSIPPMEARLSEVEKAIVRIDASLGGLATKADVMEASQGTQRWMIATVVGMMIGFGGLFLAMSNALKQVAPAVSPQPPTAPPIIINVPSAATPPVAPAPLPATPNLPAPPR